MRQHHSPPALYSTLALTPVRRRETRGGSRRHPGGARTHGEGPARRRCTLDDRLSEPPPKRSARAIGEMRESVCACANPIEQCVQRRRPVSRAKEGVGKTPRRRRPRGRSHKGRRRRKKEGRPSLLVDVLSPPPARPPPHLKTAWTPLCLATNSTQVSTSGLLRSVQPCCRMSLNVG